jgi:hypothetical protein
MPDAPPQPPTPFSAASTKIHRARAHLIELESEAAKYVAGKPVTVTGTVTENSIQIKMDVTTPVPEIISAIIGDIIHNLRAALDLAACDLVRLRNGSDKGVYFPFCDNPEELDDMIRRRHFKRAGPEAVALLRDLRPYRNGNTALRAIHDLDIQDKHQALIPAPLNFASPVFRISDDAGISISPSSAIRTRPPICVSSFPRTVPLPGKS